MSRSLLERLRAASVRLNYLQMWRRAERAWQAGRLLKDEKDALDQLMSTDNIAAAKRLIAAWANRKRRPIDLTSDE